MTETINESGITCNYDKENPFELEYIVDIDTTRITDPKESKKYFTGIIQEISNDVAGKVTDHGHSITVKIDKPYFNAFIDVARNLRYDADSKFDQKIEKLTNISLTAGALGGLTAIVTTYSPIAKVATDIGNKINDTSYLLAPIAGIAETVASLGGPAIAAVASFFAFHYASQRLSLLVKGKELKNMKKEKDRYKFIELTKWRKKKQL